MGKENAAVIAVDMDEFILKIIRPSCSICI